MNDNNENPVETFMQPYDYTDAKIRLCFLHEPGQCEFELEVTVGDESNWYTVQESLGAIEVSESFLVSEFVSDLLSAEERKALFFVLRDHMLADEELERETVFTDPEAVTTSAETPVETSVETAEARLPVGADLGKYIEEKIIESDDDLPHILTALINSGFGVYRTR